MRYVAIGWLLGWALTVALLYALERKMSRLEERAISIPGYRVAIMLLTWPIWMLFCILQFWLIKHECLGLALVLSGDLALTSDEAIEIAREHLVAERVAILELVGVMDCEECFSVSFKRPPWPGVGELTPYLRVEVNKESRLPEIMLSR